MGTRLTTGYEDFAFAYSFNQNIQQGHFILNQNEL